MYNTLKTCQNMLHYRSIKNRVGMAHRHHSLNVPKKFDKIVKQWIVKRYIIVLVLLSILGQYFAKLNTIKTAKTCPTIALSK